MLLYSQNKYIIELDKNIKNHIKNLIDPEFDEEEGIVRVNIFDKNKNKFISEEFEYPNINKILKLNYLLNQIFLLLIYTYFSFHSS